VVSAADAKAIALLGLTDSPTLTVTSSAT